MVVLVRIYALDDVLTLEIKLHELLQYNDVDRYLTQTDENSARNFLELLRLVPHVPADVLYTVPDFGFGLQDAADHILRVVARNFGDRKVTV